MLTKQKTFLGAGTGGKQLGKGTQENRSAMWFTVSGFVVMGLVSWFSLASHLAWPIFGLTQGPSWWYTHLSAKLDSSVRVSGRPVGCMVSSFLFVPSQILPVRNTTFLIRPPLARQLRQVVIIMPGQGRQF